MRLNGQKERMIEGKNKRGWKEREEMRGQRVIHRTKTETKRQK